ncbi:thyroid adenoma-associated protein homolog [Abrus precatorius]|uniref:Thyroid adenoma-associated protein homolog n=1 Tax=Abrus precatorius TaxID=3816 RepID=A0A8B8LSJ9_ABRPR|nr:thyroid adenoma-associated protein homolog [Abrus precatorius]
MSSAKWRALQHRHRYTYTAVVFPPSFLDSLGQLLSHPLLSPFHSSLLHLTSLSSTFSQLSHTKHLSSTFSLLFSLPEPPSQPQLRLASSLYLELLFLDNSLPLHRTLLSSLAKTRAFHSTVAASFKTLCQDYTRKGKPFAVSRAALSVLGFPKLGFLVDVVEDCAVLVACDAVHGLNGVVSETGELARPSPIVMEQSQEALSCLYYLLQKFPSKFGSENGAGCSSVMEGVVIVVLSVLSSYAFSRDCFVAAGVAFCAALQVCLSLEELGLVLIRGLFDLNSGGDCCDSEFRNAIRKVPCEGDVYEGICGLSVLSRLCLIRGILTAVSRDLLNTRFGDVNGCDVPRVGGSMSFKTVLYDGILPELCKYCENPVDGHFNFHALTVMQICLQQIKTSLLSNLTDTSGGYDPLPEEMGMRILRIIWNNLEDPLSQTVKQVHLIFDLFLDIQSSLCWSEGGEKINKFLQKIGLDLLSLGSRCKGRYVPLALLTKRLGAKKMLDMRPDLLFETIQAYVDDDVCCAATSFLKCFLEYLRDECWETDGIEGGYSLYRRHCLPPILYGLASGFSKLRTNLNTYALPVLLEIDVDSIFPMLSFISVGPNGDENGLHYPELVNANMEVNLEQRIAILVSLLKVSRSLALVEGDIDWSENPSANGKEPGLGIESHALVCIKGINVKICVQWLVNALTHVDESLRVDAAESLFLNPKTSSLPSHLELTLMKEAVPLNMRCCSSAFQMKWCSLFRKFFSRVRTALERQFKQGSWNPLENNKGNEVYHSKGNSELTIERADDLFHFMRWLSGFLFFSCYPSAPYKRKIMAMGLILIMINVWSIKSSSSEEFNSSLSGNNLYPYSKGMTSSDSTLLLVGSIIDSWDRLRESSFHILLHFPTPLPGISSEDTLKKLIASAMKLVCSPRVRESDAGALTLRLIFRKYVLELGWLIEDSFNAVHLSSKSELVNEAYQSRKFRNPVILYLKSMIDWLDAAVRDGEQDLSKACKNSFVHGVLLALRYTFEELDWNSVVISSGISELRYLLGRLLELVVRITSLALWVVSADAWCLPEDMDEMLDEDNLLLEIPDHEHIPSSEYENNNSKPSHDVRSSEQIVMVGCWLAMKEVSLLLGTIIRKVPLPSNASSDLSELDGPSVDTAGFSSDSVLDLEQLETIGNHFLEVLLKMKHNGAIDKTRAGFTALCNRLLCSNDLKLHRLTESWMEQLMQRTVAKGQVVDDLLRRSAGIPAAFTALFLSEPEGTPKKLLPWALRWLIDVGNGSMLHQIESNSLNGEPCKSNDSTEENNFTQTAERNARQMLSKIRDEGVIPTVHAFNVLRAAFNDSNLGTDTSGFSAEALILSIRSFSSPYWEIRNSACLAYTALVRRMIGFLNVHKRESARRALTGLEFFHRYPSLHSFLFKELEVATEFLGCASSGDLESIRGNNLHPSLYPILILLSRLRPSSIAGETGDELDPFLFMPWIRRCSTQSNLRVRVLASRALTSLVSNEKLSSVLLNIASDLPSHGSYSISFNFIHGILLQLTSLLDVNCRNLADNSKKDHILGELIQILVLRSWIAKPTHCPCPILNETFLRVLDQMLNIARRCQITKHFYSIRNLLLELSTECLDLESYGLPYYDPTVAELREQAAISYFGCFFQASKDEEEIIHLPPRHSLPSSESLRENEMANASVGLLDRLIRCLSDSLYEVRYATLKWLLKFLKVAEPCDKLYDLSSNDIRAVQLWAKANLNGTLVKILASERNYRCTYYILRILVAWNLQQFENTSCDKCTGKNSSVGEMDFNSVLQFWNELVSLYKQTRHAKTRETLVHCLGVCIKRITMLFASSILSNEGMELTACGGINQEMLSWLFDCIVFFCNMIKRCSSPSEPTSMRQAAAESLIASGLLEQARLLGSVVLNNHIPFGISSCFVKEEAVNLYAHHVLDAWFTGIKLLEDEDDLVRLRLSSDVQKCFTTERTRSNLTPGLVPIQVDRVIRFCFDHLSSIFGHWIDYFNYLCQWVLCAESYVAPRGDLVRRVFDKEIDNHYEEKLLISQICCSNMEKLPILKFWADKDEFRSYLHGWRNRFSHQLVSYAQDHIGKEEGNEWIGGVGNHKDAFLPLYANLLGFYALSNCIFLVSGNNDAKLLLSDVVVLGRAINPFLRNPLISNLYNLVLKSHEKMAGDVANGKLPEMGNYFLWDSFHPYFLLG